MSVRLFPVMSLVVLASSSTVLAQSGTTLSGELSTWRDGSAEIVLLAPRHIPPPFVRPANSPTIGTVAGDGSFRLTIPERFPEDEFVPVVDYLDSNCSGASLEPRDAVYFPMTYGVYKSDGTLIGEIFRGSPGAGRGPAPGEFSTLPGYANRPFTLRGECPDPSRRVVEDYDFSVEAGWHEIVQSFAEHPDQSGWRIDRWRNEPVPANATWTLIRPPR